MNSKNIIVRCPNCGTKNRIPGHRLTDRPICGKCKGYLPVPASDHRPVEVSDKTFNTEVLTVPGPVLVDCWAPWCGPCRMVSPVLDQLATQYAGHVKFTKVNVDENPAVASQFEIRSIPTLLLFRQGKLVDRMVGALPKTDIERHLVLHLQ